MTLNSILLLRGERVNKNLSRQKFDIYRKSYQTLTVIQDKKDVLAVYKNILMIMSFLHVLFLDLACGVEAILSYTKSKLSHIPITEKTISTKK